MNVCVPVFRIFFNCNWEDTDKTQILVVLRRLMMKIPGFFCFGFLNWECSLKLLLNPQSANKKFMKFLSIINTWKSEMNSLILNKSRLGPFKAKHLTKVEKCSFCFFLASWICTIIYMKGMWRRALRMISHLITTLLYNHRLLVLIYVFMLRTYLGI